MGWILHNLAVPSIYLGCLRAAVLLVLRGKSSAWATKLAIFGAVSGLNLPFFAVCHPLIG
jgi:hypothetical protein